METVIAGNNGKITEWIKRKVATKRIQPLEIRISSITIGQVDIQRINNITISNYNTILTQLAKLEIEYDIPSYIITTITDKFEENLQNPEEQQQLT